MRNTRPFSPYHFTMQPPSLLPFSVKGPKWDRRNPPDSWEGLPVIARGVPKSGHSPDGPDFGEARPAWGAVPECNASNQQPGNYGKPAGTGAPSPS